MGDRAKTVELAHKLSRAFETATRPTGERYVRLKDGSPEWMTHVIREAHREMLPDDWRYACVAAAAEAIAEADDPADNEHEFADGYVDVYNADLFDWLASHHSRQGYVDEAADELGAAVDLGVVERIGLGQYAEAREVFGLVLRSLQKIAENA